MAPSYNFVCEHVNIVLVFTFKPFLKTFVKFSDNKNNKTNESKT